MNVDKEVRFEKGFYLFDRIQNLLQNTEPNPTKTHGGIQVPGFKQEVEN